MEGCDDFLNSGFIDQDQIDQTVNLDIDKYFLETSRDSLTLDASLLRCAQSSRGANFQCINYSPIESFQTLSPPSYFNSPLQKINEASFDLSDSCFLCTTSNDEYYNTESKVYHEIYQNFLENGAVTNTTESSFEFEASNDDEQIQTNSKSEQSSVFKRNESSRVSCHTIYNYLIKPIKKKFKCNSKKTETKKIADLSSKHISSNQIQVTRHINRHSNVNIAVSRHREVLHDNNLNKVVENTNPTYGLADPFHKCGDLVYYLV